jgi:hypothetical protein
MIGEINEKIAARVYIDRLGRKEREKYRPFVQENKK